MATGNEPQHSKETRSIFVAFACPNYRKKLHVGYLRSRVIGDTICNLSEDSCHRVVRVSHSRDLGSAMTTLLASIVTEKVLRFGENGLLLSCNVRARKEAIGIGQDWNFTSLVKHIVLLLQQPENPSSGSCRDIFAMWQHICALTQHSPSGFSRAWIWVVDWCYTVQWHHLPEESKPKSPFRAIISSSTTRGMNC